MTEPERAGATAGLVDLADYCERHGLTLGAPDELGRRGRRRRLVERVVATRLPTRFGEFTAVGFQALGGGAQHLALVRGRVADAHDVPVRIHTQCLAAEVFHSLRCSCAAELEHALRVIDREGIGVLLYLTRPGRALDPPSEQEGRDPEAKLADQGIEAQILEDLGVRSIRLLALASSPVTPRTAARAATPG